LTDTVAAARSALDEAQLTGKTIEAVIAGRQLPPEVQNMLIGLKDAAADPRRLMPMMRELAAEASTAKPAMDAVADAVERVRAMTTEQLQAAAQPKPAAQSGDPVMASVAARLERLETSRPDLPVRITEEGQRITAREELAQARKLADEGSADELGAKDAGLFQVAAECALLVGAT
jgi:hypothetical protein